MLLKKLSTFLTYFDVASLYIFLFGLNSLLIYIFFFTTNNLQQYKMSNFLTNFFFLYIYRLSLYRIEFRVQIKW